MQRRAELRSISGRSHVNTEPVHASTTAGARWIGRTEIALINGRGQRTTAVDVVIRPRTISLRHRKRTLADMERAAFREWLSDPRGTLRTQGVLWFVHTGLTCISIPGLGCFVIPGSCMANLTAVA